MSTFTGRHAGGGGDNPGCKQAKQKVPISNVTSSNGPTLCRDDARAFPRQAKSDGLGFGCGWCRIV